MYSELMRVETLKEETPSVAVVGAITGTNPVAPG